MPFHKRNEQDFPLSPSQLDENNQLTEDLYSGSSTSANDAANSAAEAEAARDAANFAGNIYASIAEGLANTVDGEFFSVSVSGADTLYDYYKNVGGSDSYISSFRIVPANPDATPSLIADFVNQDFRAAGDFGLADIAFSSLFSFARASDGTRIDHLNLIDTRSSNEYRIQYDYDTGESLGLLIESSVTNLMLQSSVINSASWLKLSGGVGSNPVVTANFATAPDGTMMADRVQFDLNGGTTGSDLSYLEQTIANTIGERRESTFWLKSNTGVDQAIKLSLSNKDSDIPNTDSFITVTPEWDEYLIGIESTTDTTNNPRLSLRGNDPETGDTADLLVARGMCYDNHVGPTSSIETFASQVTRAAETCTLIGGSGILNPNQGSFYIEFVAPALPESGSTNRFMRLSDGTANNWIDISQSSNGQFFLLVTVGGSPAGNVMIGSYTAGLRLKIAFNYDQSSTTVYVNGDQYTGVTSPAFTADLDELSVGHASATAANTAIAKVIYRGAQLTNDELRGSTL